jgi:hypothetical protein
LGARKKNLELPLMIAILKKETFDKAQFVLHFGCSNIIFIGYNLHYLAIQFADATQTTLLFPFLRFFTIHSFCK